MRVIELRSDIDPNIARFLKEEIKLADEKYGHLTEEEINKLNEEQLNEWIVPALMAVSAGITGWQMYKQYKPQFDKAGGGKAGWEAIKKPLMNDLAAEAAILGLSGGAIGVGKAGFNFARNALRARRAKKATDSWKKAGYDDVITKPNKVPVLTKTDKLTTAASTAAGTAAAAATDWDNVTWMKDQPVGAQ